jgi:hypothetical protein
MVTRMTWPAGRSERGLEHDEIRALGPAHGQLPLTPLLRWTVLVAGVTTIGILHDRDALGPNAVANSVFHELIRAVLSTASLPLDVALTASGITLLCTRVGDGRPPEAQITPPRPRSRPWWLG